MLCGHSHIARAVRLSDGRLIVNPGSVGSPGYRDIHPFPHVMEAGTPDARYAILELLDGELECNVPPRALRSQGDGGAGAPQRPAGTGRCAGDGMDQIARVARHIDTRHTRVEPGHDERELCGQQLHRDRRFSA